MPSFGVLFFFFQSNHVRYAGCKFDICFLKIVEADSKCWKAVGDITFRELRVLRVGKSLTFFVKNVSVRAKYCVSVGACSIIEEYAVYKTRNMFMIKNANNCHHQIKCACKGEYSEPSKLPIAVYCPINEKKEYMSWETPADNDHLNSGAC